MLHVVPDGHALGPAGVAGRLAAHLPEHGWRSSVFAFGSPVTSGVAGWRALSRELDALEPDAIHAWGEATRRLAGPALRKWGGRLIVSPHEGPPGGVLEWAGGRLAPAGRAVAAPRPCAPAVDGAPPKTGTPLILAAGRLRARRLFDPVVRAFDYLRLVHADWRFSLLGDGPEWGRLLRLHWGLSRQRPYLVAPGWPVDWCGRLASAWAVMVPGDDDGGDVVLAEARAAGVPAVVSRDPVMLARRARELLEQGGADAEAEAGLTWARKNADPATGARQYVTEALQPAD